MAEVRARVCVCCVHVRACVCCVGVRACACVIRYHVCVCVCVQANAQCLEQRVACLEEELAQAAWHRREMDGKLSKLLEIVARLDK